MSSNYATFFIKADVIINNYRYFGVLFVLQLQFSDSVVAQRACVIDLAQTGSSGKGEKTQRERERERDKRAGESAWRAPLI